MSIEHDVAALTTRIDTMDQRHTSGLAELAGTVRGLDNQVQLLNGKVDGLHGKFEGLDGRFDGLDRKVEGLQQEVSDLRREMHVLHEDTIANIKALAPDFAPIRREFREADATLREEFDRRIVPLEAIARRQRKPPAR